MLDIVFTLCYNKQVVEILTAYGSIAQLGEHLPYKQRVIGSSPIVSTNDIASEHYGVRLYMAV